MLLRNEKLCIVSLYAVSKDALAALANGRGLSEFLLFKAKCSLSPVGM